VGSGYRQPCVGGASGFLSEQKPALESASSSIIGRGKEMYAVIETGGKQYKVSEGMVIEVEKLPVSVGEEVELDKVLMVVDDNGVRVGQPFLEGAKVKALVQAQIKGPKIIVFKYKPKKRYRRKKGHRQLYTRLLIKEIIA